MKLVINVPDYIKEQADDGKGEEFGIPLWLAYEIANGTPLPKRHGRLIDADELYGDFIDGTEGYDCQTWNRIDIGDIIEDAPTIIEADKAESEQAGNPDTLKGD